MLLEVEKNRASTQRLLTYLEKKIPFIPISAHMTERERNHLLSHLPTTDNTLFAIATSGSTALPKIITHSLTYLHRLTLPSFIQVRYPQPSRVGIILPLYTMGGLTAFLSAVYTNQQIVFLENRNALFHAAITGSIDQCTLTPAHLFYLIESLIKTGAVPPKPIRLLVGAAPLNPLLALQAKKCNLEIQIAYGMSEMPSILIDGIPSEGVEAHLDGKQLCIRSIYLGTNVPKNKEGFFETGDSALFDHVRYHIEGRLGKSINVGGFKIDPAEIEQIACMHPSVLTAHLKAIPDPALGFSTELVITPIGPCNLDELAVYLRNRLHPKKIPGRIRKSSKLDYAIE